MVMNVTTTAEYVHRLVGLSQCRGQQAWTGKYRTQRQKKLHALAA